MSSQPIDRQGSRRFVCPILLIGALLIAQTVLGQETVVDGVRPHPLIVRPLPGDTPATLARRYLNDASKAWMIEEFNGKVAASPDNALLIPVAPFRRGGLRPDGFQSVPVLVYKDADHRPPDADAAVTEAIRRQLQWLKRNGFTAVTPSQLVDFLNFSGQLPQRSILITADTQSGWFGDGMAPVLREFDFPAIVFVATGHVGAKGAMTWDQLRRLHQDGFVIGCRGENGRSLARRKPGQSFEANFKWIESELEKAKAAVENHLGTSCRFLAYPQGGSNGLIAAMAAKVGFAAGFTLDPGDNPFFTDRFRIHRIAVDKRSGPEQFAGRLTTLIETDLK